jgi:hypothetical protein
MLGYAVGSTLGSLVMLSSFMGWAKKTALLGVTLGGPPATAFLVAATRTEVSDATTITLGTLLGLLGAVFALLGLVSAGAVAYFRYFVSDQVHIEVTKLRMEIQAVRKEMVTRELLKLYVEASHARADDASGDHGFKAGR